MVGQQMNGTATRQGTPATRTMRAVVLEDEGGPEVLVVRDVAVPEPGAGELLLRVSHAALNHLDVWIRRGLPSVPKPRIMGADACGSVESVGPGVDPGRVGERVLLDPGLSCGTCRYCVGGDTALCDDFHILGEHCAGTHAGYVVVPAANAHPVPGHLDDAHAAALGLVFGTAWRMLSRARLRPGERMLVWGASAGVGSAAVQLAHAMGVETIALSRSEEKLATCLELGATHALSMEGDDLEERVDRVTAGEGVDVVFDHLGKVAWKPSLLMLAKNGRYVTCGATTGPNPPASITRIFWKQLSIIGSTMAGRHDFQQMLRFVRLHRITPRVDTVFDLDDASAAHAHLEEARQVGKVVLRVASS